MEKFFLWLREIIALELEVGSEAMFGGDIEVDESYFGGRCKGRRGRGAGPKIPVFCLLKRGGKFQGYPKRFQRHLFRHSELLTDKQNRINGIDNFWN